MNVLLTQSQWERCRTRTKCECRRCVGRDSEQFSKSNNSCGN